jgi:UDP-glucose 4-epimerase
MKGFSFYNVATLDYISVKEIADIVTDVLGIRNVEYIFSGGDRGWKGDVPVVRLNSVKIRELGWQNMYNSFESIRKSVSSMYNDAKAGKFN